MLVAELCAQFVHHLRHERQMSANTCESYARDLRAMAEALRRQGVHDVEAVEEAHLRGHLRQMAQRGGAPASQRRAVSALRQLFLYAQRERLLIQSPARQLEAPAVPRKLPAVPTAKQAAHLLDVLGRDVTPQGLRDSVALELLYGAGLRASELCALTVDDVDVDLGLLRARGKGNKERVVPIGEPAVEALRRYLAKGRTELLGGAGHAALLVSNRGAPMQRVGLFALVKRRAQAAGLPINVSPHTLRHAFATHLLHGGADLRAVQEMLGHASIATTEIYTHVGEQALQRTVDLHHPLARAQVDLPRAPGAGEPAAQP